MNRHSGINEVLKLNGTGNVPLPSPLGNCGWRRAFFIRLLFLLVLACLFFGLPFASSAQTIRLADAQTIWVEGRVCNFRGDPIAGASVFLEEKDHSASVIEAKTSVDGSFVISPLRPGDYMLRAKKDGFGEALKGPLALSKGDRKHFSFALGAIGETPAGSSKSSSPAASAMEFADKPSFTVAGITDWTAVGGHGADTNLRASETLAKETVALNSDAATGTSVGAAGFHEATTRSGGSAAELKNALVREPRSFEANHGLGEFYLTSRRYSEAVPLLASAYRISPKNYSNRYDLALAYKGSGDLWRSRKEVQAMLTTTDKSELHRLLGDLDEELNDPLDAEHEYERAVHLNPEEQNYFRWGTELLLHRAIQPAVEVFENGGRLYPGSARMLAGLGAALYASGSYGLGALKLCAASDLNPSDSGPYIFLGQMEQAAPAPLPCVEQKLQRFAHDRPEAALADYYYAMAIWKRQPEPAGRAALLQLKALLEKAVTLDPKLGDAYLQLGILYSDEGNSHKAINAFQKAITDNPTAGEAHYRLAMVYQRMGDNPKAEREFKLHDQCELNEAEAIERQRRDIRQFLVVLRDRVQSSPASLN